MSGIIQRLAPIKGFVYRPEREATDTDGINHM